MDVTSVMGMSVWASAKALGSRIPDVLGSIQASLGSERSALSLELGAGAGLPSLVAASFNYRVIVSDDDADVERIFANNVQANYALVSERAQFRRLDWDDEEQRTAFASVYPELFDCIFGTDVLYQAQGMNGIARTVHHLMRR
jgi:predicted nicotinamide N-methyase